MINEKKSEKDDVEERFSEIIAMIEALGSGKPVQVRAPSAKGPKISVEDVAKWNKAADLSNTLSDKVDNLIRETEDLDKMRQYIREIQVKIGEFVEKDDY